MNSSLDISLTGNMPDVTSSRRSTVLAEAHNNLSAEPLEDLSKIETSTNKRIHFEHDEELDFVIAQIIDKESGEIVRQVPSEDSVEHLKYEQRIKGAIVNMKI